MEYMCLLSAGERGCTAAGEGGVCICSETVRAEEGRTGVSVWWW